MNDREFRKLIEEWSKQGGDYKVLKPEEKLIPPKGNEN